MSENQTSKPDRSRLIQQARNPLACCVAICVRASEPNLFWTLKGGGGNFGVVTAITYRMYPITTVISGMFLHLLAHAREVMRFYHDFVMSGLPANRSSSRRTLHA